MKKKDMKLKSHFKVGSMVEGRVVQPWSGKVDVGPDKIVDMKIEYDQKRNPHERNRRDAVGCFVYIKLENDSPRAWRNAKDFWNVKD